MDTLVDPAPSLASQLYRYARDLDDLLAQHENLQRRHLALLQRHGLAEHAEDQVLELAGRARCAQVETDARGRVTKVNREGERLLAGRRDLLERVAERDRAPFEELFARLAGPGTDESALLLDFELAEAAPADAADCVALALPVRGDDAVRIAWVLRPGPIGRSPVAALQWLLPMEGTDLCLMLVTPDATIAAVNANYCHVSEYRADELIGQAAGLLRSGHHGHAFYRSFWQALADAGCWSGEFLNRRKSGGVYPEWKSVRTVRSGRGELLCFIVAARDLSARHIRIERLSRLAYYDALTGLPNRRLLHDRMVQAARVAERETSGLAVLFMDLDGFKAINDRWGHEVGDELLRVLGQRMQGAVRAGDTVARVGGDEFAVLLPRLAEEADVAAVADKLIAQVTAPLMVGGVPLHVGLSIGCARYPRDDTGSERLMRLADLAMYYSKRAGGNRLSFHDAPSRPRGVSELSVDLWGAIERGEMRLVYQPQVTTGRPRRLRGCEAQLRWVHPVCGEVDATQLMALAERTGAIVPIGRWMLETACADAARWHGQGLRDIVVSVDVTARQLEDTGLVAALEAALADSGIAPQRLELQLASTTPGPPGQASVLLLRQLRRRGVRVAIDDFGSGPSSLRRAYTVEADTLKVDGLFVADVETRAEARALTRCAVSVGTALGLQVIAHGVGSAAQEAVLAAQGCPVIQGRVTGDPMAAADLWPWAIGQGLAVPVRDDAAPAGGINGGHAG